jgi:ABC-type nitrate/sulfonate/bicarbonate transport system substrate-binding protein
LEVAHASVSVGQTRHLHHVVLALAMIMAIGAQPPAGAAEPSIRIAFPSGMNGQVVVAMEKAGIARQHGLSAQFSSFQYGPPMMEALAAGSIDAVVTSLMPVTSYAAKLPGDIKIVAMAGQSSHALLVDKDSPITAGGMLDGKTLGVSFGSDSHLDTLVWLKEIGLAGKVTLVNIAPAELATALYNKSVDAIVIRQPQVLRLQQQSGARVLHTWPFRFIAIVKSKYNTDHPRQVEEFVAALRDSFLFIAQHHQQAATWFGESLRADPAIIEAASKEDPFYNANSLEQIEVSVKPTDRELITKWAAEAYTEKMIKRPLDVGLLFR